jgi:4-carboxymuconolactone decarboxylase
MPRITVPDVADEDLPEELRDNADALINVFRIILRSPRIATLVAELGSAQFGSGSLPGPDRELAILTSGSCFGSAYEASQHEQISDAVGVTSAQRAAIAVHQWDSPDLTSSQQALVAFVAAVAEGPTVPDDIFDAVQLHYTDQQVVEIVVLTGYYFLIARVTTVLEVPQDPQEGDAVLRAGVSVNGDQ